MNKMMENNTMTQREEYVTRNKCREDKRNNEGS